MGMYDDFYITETSILPFPDYIKEKEKYFQTKNTPEQNLVTYCLRDDGYLFKYIPFFPKSGTPIKSNLTSIITIVGGCGEGCGKLIEFELNFENGKLMTAKFIDVWQ